MTGAWVLALALPPFVAWLAIVALRRSDWREALADHPNERSLHATPTPRIGGLGILAGALPVALWLGPRPLTPLLAAAGTLAFVSLVDDVRSLPIQVRLPAHFAAALAACAAMNAWPSAPSEWLWATLSVLAIVWMTNLFNFMDGSDGLAGGMAAIGFGAFAAGAYAAGDVPLALACAAFATANLGFLTQNLPPARVFMGDAGAIPLGFLAGAIGLHGVVKGTWPIEFPLLAFSPFIVDATVTLARRMLRGEPFWKAHRTHAYQRLVLAGWSRGRLAVTAYALMLASALSALLARDWGLPARSAIISVWAVIYLLLLLTVERTVRRKAAASARTQKG